MHKSRKTSVGYTSLFSLFAANILPIFGVIFFSWSLSLILEFYIVETIIVAFMVLIRVFLGPNCSFGDVIGSIFLFLFFMLIVLVIGIAITSYFPKEDVATPSRLSLILFFVGLIGIQIIQIGQDYLGGNLNERYPKLHIFEILSRIIFIFMLPLTLPVMKDADTILVVITIVFILMFKFFLEFLFYAYNYIDTKFST